MDIRLPRICTTYKNGRVELVEYAGGYEITYALFIDGYVLSKKNPRIYFGKSAFFNTAVATRYKTYLEAEAALIVYLAWDNYPSVIGGIKS